MEKDILLDAAKETTETAVTLTAEERLGVPASLALGFAYIMACTANDAAGKGWLLVFAAALCVGVEYVPRGVRRSRESWVWLGCLWACLLGGTFGPNRVWDEYAFLIFHAFGAYWMLVRSGRLLGRGSSAFLPVDLVHGLVIVPFGNLLLRLRVIRVMSTNLREERRLNPLALLAALCAVALGLTLFCLAAILLSDADANFEHLAGGALYAIARMGIDSLLLRLVLSLPVGAWLYGLVFGLKRESPEAVLKRRSQVEAIIEALSRVPGFVWPAMMGLFAAMYAVFFTIQGSYLFDGLRGVLPEAFTAAEYAHRGFSELCVVMAVNFTLLGAAAISTQGGLRANAAAKALSALLIVESALFAVTAGAKLWLYISRFGFTPLRLESAWLVSVLLAGCLAALRHLFTGKDSTCPWMIFAGVTLSITCLI